jgi:hypothetical protein
MAPITSLYVKNEKKKFKSKLSKLKIKKYPQINIYIYLKKYYQLIKIEKKKKKKKLN